MNMYSNELYKEMKKAAAECEHKHIVNFDELLQFDASMFEYDDIPEDIREYFELFELWLCSQGCVAVGPLNGKYVFATGGLGGGKINEYGFMTEFIGATRNGQAVKWTVGKDCVVFWNNLTKTPDLDLTTAAELLTEIDVSLDYNVLYSRYFPVPLADDERQKSQIESIFNNLKSGGKVMSIINRKKTVQDALSGQNEIPVLNLTDVKNSDKIQYLSHFRDDVKRWFTTKYGQAVQGTGKQAQQSIEEIDGNTSVSFAYPLIKFYCRKKAVDALNELFGFNMSVRFSPIWAVEFNKFIQESTEMDEMEEIQEAAEQEEIQEETAGQEDIKEVEDGDNVDNKQDQ